MLETNKLAATNGVKTARDFDRLTASDSIAEISQYISGDILSMHSCNRNL